MGRRWAVMCAVALALALATSSFADKLVVATYNLENYLATDRLIEKVYRTEYPKPEAAKAAVRAVVRIAGADVLALQEIGALPYLKELQRDLAKEGMDYPYAELLQAADPDRHVAVLSRRPLLNVRKHTELPFEYFGRVEQPKRGLLEVSVDFGGAPLTIFVLHLKSRYTDRSDDPQSSVRRAGEAEAIRERLLVRFADPALARFLVAGDFNDGPRSKTLQVLTRRGRLAVAEMLSTVDSRGESWTHAFRKEESYSRIDYVLVSPGLMPCVANGRARIVDAPETRDASDHRPVVVELESR